MLMWQRVLEANLSLLSVDANFEMLSDPTPHLLALSVRPHASSAGLARTNVPRPVLPSAAKER